MRRPYNIKLNEQGFASIVIALILVIVLALLTVGFAQLARREQQSALDKQKATQAYFAAESGINDAYKDILNGTITKDGAGGTVKADSRNCMHPTAGYTQNANVNSATGVSYTCLLVALETSNFQFDNTPPNSGKHMTFTTSDTLSTLTVAWGSSDGRNDFPGNTGTKFPSLSDWHVPSDATKLYPPVIQFSITPTSSLDEQTLVDKTFNVYLYPATSGGSSCTVAGKTYSSCVNVSSGQGQVISGNCQTTPTTYPCKVTLTGLGDQSYVIHFVDFYDASNLLGTGANGSGTSVTFEGEPMIDVTGKARDALKRVQVRLLIHGGTNSSNDNLVLPNGAIEAQNLCKRIQAAPPTVDFPAGSSIDTTNVQSNGSCNVFN